LHQRFILPQILPFTLPLILMLSSAHKSWGIEPGCGKELSGNVTAIKAPHRLTNLFKRMKQLPGNYQMEATHSGELSILNTVNGAVLAQTDVGRVAEASRIDLDVLEEPHSYILVTSDRLNTQLVRITENNVEVLSLSKAPPELIRVLEKQSIQRLENLYAASEGSENLDRPPNQASKETAALAINRIYRLPGDHTYRIHPEGSVHFYDKTGNLVGKTTLEDINRAKKFTLDINGEKTYFVFANDLKAEIIEISKDGVDSLSMENAPTKLVDLMALQMKAPIIAKIEIKSVKELYRREIYHIEFSYVTAPGVHNESRHFTRKELEYFLQNLELEKPEDLNNHSFHAFLPVTYGIGPLLKRPSRLKYQSIEF